MVNEIKAVVDLIGHIAWPIVVITIVFVLRQQFRSLFDSLNESVSRAYPVVTHTHYI